MKQLIKKYFPISLVFVLFVEFFYDYIRYIKHSGVLNVLGKENKLIGRIIAEYHVVEKGLTMPETRLGFGKENLLSLIKNIDQYTIRYNKTNPQLIAAASVVKEYQVFHESKQYKLDNVITNSIRDMELNLSNIEACTQSSISKADYFSKSESEFKSFSNSRRSVRNYSAKEIPLNTLIDCVDLARNTPSSCNRQGTRVYIFSDRQQIDSILQLQGGNRGFGHLANKIIVITNDQGISHGVYEKHQTYVDGGMFTMNLLYALHNKHIASCPLNCNFSISKDKQMRTLCNVDDSEVFISILSCGYTPDTFQIAHSERYPLSKIIKTEI